jgi:4-amino-4-deoxy-L-arabinose transferase-like glycosyltransferase
VNFKGFRRRLRFRLFRFGRLGKLKFTAFILLFAAALAFHLTIAVTLVNDEPGDSKIYLQLAANIVERGVYSEEPNVPFTPTFIRTPGYPLFLAGISEIGGVGNETAIRVAQAVLFWLTCIIVAMIASQWVDVRKKTTAVIAAFILAAFCPFTVILSATILSEIPTMFLLAASILSAAYALRTRKTTRSFIWWGITGVAAGTNVLFRPDAGLFALGIGLTLVFSVFIGTKAFTSRLADRSLQGIVFSLAFILPLIPWTIRNEAVFGVFQPLSPAHAEMPGEFVPHGYYKWLRTWIDDSAYIDPLIWRLEIKPLRIEDVPVYAFSSAEEKREVAELFDEYNSSDPEHPAVPPRNSNALKADDQNNDQASSDDEDDENNGDSGDGDNQDQADSGDQQEPASSPDEEWDLKITPDIDAKFAAIANDRIKRDPWCYYLCLPAKRAASMWFDTHSDWYPFNGELFPLEDLDHDTSQHIWLPLFAGLNLIYTFLAFAGLWALRRMRAWLWLFLVLAISLPRIAFFGTIENPEPRYLVELFIPAAILGGVFLSVVIARRSKSRDADLLSTFNY